jgi:serine/threonine-protein kinase
VLDFGIAKIVAEHATRGATTTGMIGTPLWMAPEQTERGRITPAADVWALGLILYHVLVGQSYWRTGADPHSTYAQILKEVVMGPMPVASVRAREQGSHARWPGELDLVFARSVSRDPQKRFQTAHHFWNAVREVLARHAPPTSSPRLSSPQSARIHAGAPLSAGADKTVAVAPPVPTGPTPIAPAPMPAYPRAEPILSAPFGATSDLAGIPIRVVIGAIVLVLAVLLIAIVATARSRDAQSEKGPAKLSPVIGPPTTGGPMTAAPRCRLCTSSVTVDGPVAKDGIVSAMEAGFSRLDAQCLTTSKRRVSAGVVTLAFTVQSGQASNRRIESPPVRDGADECIVRALGDIPFPSHADPTHVTYTLRFDPAVR